MSDDALYDLVIEWDNQRQQGNEVSAEVICSDKPELVEALKSRIQSVKATDWLVETDDGDDNFLSLPDTATAAAYLDETTVPPTEFDVDQFLLAACKYGFIDDDDVGALRKTENGDTTRSIAAQLVAENRLTHYQADVLLRQSGEPLMLDRYEVLDKLDQGGMGIVYRARHRSMDRQVAVKILPPGTVASPERTQRFQREVKAAAKLSHPNIVASYDAHEANGIHFLVMEYVAGKDLSKVVNETGPLSVSDSLKHILQAAVGLEHAHKQGIVHRDVKPSNLILDESGNVKVLDMGLASFTSGDTHVVENELTSEGAVMGTMAYMSPEQGLDSRRADHRSDIYSLGCTLYFLLSGRPPYQAQTAIETLLAHRDLPIPLLKDQQHDVPERLVKVFNRMVAKRPEDRQQSMTEVIDELQSCLTKLKNHRSESNPLQETEEYKQTRFLEPRSIGLRSIVKHPIAIAAAFLVLALGGWFIYDIVFKVKTGHGTLVIEVSDPENVSVLIDGQQAKLKLGDDGKTVVISVNPGTHNVQVMSDGLSMSTDAEGGKVSIKSRGRQVVRAWFELNATHIAKKNDPSKNPAPRTPLPGGPSGLVAILKGHTHAVTAVRFAPDGRHVLSKSRDRTIRLWKLESGREVGKFKGGNASLAFAPNGQSFASCEGKDIVLRDTTNGSEIFRLRGHSLAVFGVAFSPSGQQVASCSGDQTVRIWDVEKGIEIQKLQGHSDRVNCVSFSADGNKILSGSNDNSVRLWDPKTGAQLKRLDGHRNSVETVAFSPNGRHAASSGWDSVIRLWDLRTGRSIRVLSGHEALVGSLSFSRDGLLLYSGSRDKSLRVWNVATGTEIHRFEADSYATMQMAVSPDECFIVSGSGRYKDDKGNHATDGDFALRVWRLPQSNFGPHTPLPDGPAGRVAKLEGHKARVRAVAVSPDGRYVFSSAADKTVRMWDLRKQIAIRQLDGVRTSISDLTISADGRYVVGVGGLKKIYKWDVTNGRLVQEFSGHSKTVQGVKFFDNGKKLVSCSSDGSVRIWNVETSQQIDQLDTGSSFLFRVAMSPDNRFALITGKELLLWDTEGDTKSTLVAEPPTLGSAGDVVFLPNGRHALTSHGSGQIVLWDISTGQAVRRFKGHAKGAGVLSLAVNLNGHFFLSGAKDKTVRIWDVASGSERHRIDCESNCTSFVALTPDGRFAISGGGTLSEPGKDKSNQDYALHIWRLPSPDLLAQNDADREIGIWVLNAGGQLEVARFDGSTTHVARKSEFPKDYFRITEVNLNDSLSFTDADLLRLHRLSALKTLRLSRTRITDHGLKNLSGLSELEDLFIMGVTNTTPAGLAYLQNIPRLWRLGLGQTSDEALEEIAKLKRLRLLSINGPGITDSSIAHLLKLKQIRYLNLRNTDVTDRGLQRLKELSTLVSLDLTGSKVTDGGINELQKALPNCEIKKDNTDLPDSTAKSHKKNK